MVTSPQQPSRLSSDRSIHAPAIRRVVAFIVWGVWLALVIAGFGFVWNYGTNLPFSDDFEMVPMLCGQIDDYPAWLWSFCAEHRVPLPRLIQHGLYKLTDNDFRAGMFFNVAALGALSAAMIWTAGRIRNHISITDIFFPSTLLHWGHWENLLWSWQVQLVSSSVIAGVWLITVVGSSHPLSWGRSILVSVCVLMLPLCGANGLALVPALALWLMVAGIWQMTKGRRAAISGGVMLTGALGATALVYAYFIGFQKTDQGDPSVVAALRTAGEFITTSLGPAAKQYWPESGWFVVGATVIGVLLLTVAVRKPAVERIPALGILVFIGGIGSLALGLGWGRANLSEGQGFATRYVTLAAPLLCALYFAGLCQCGLIGRLFQIVLCLAAVIALRPNMMDGLRNARERRELLAPIEADLANGVSLSLMAQKHTQSFAILDWEQLREDFLRKLKTKNIGPFRTMSDDPKVKEIRIPIEPLRVRNAEWDHGVLRSTSKDPLVVFGLGRPQFVYAIRFRWSYVNASAPADGELFWCDSARNEFNDKDHHITWPEHTHLGERTRTVWINDTIDLFRLDPDSKPCVFKLHEIVLLVPADESRTP